MARLDEAGYRGEWVCLKSDGESSIVAMQKAVGEARVGRTGIIKFPVRGSQANGACEAAIKVFQGQLRTFKHQMEHNFGLQKKARGCLWMAQ